MKISQVIFKDNVRYAEIEDVNKEGSIEYDEKTSEVLELHFGYVLSINELLSKHGYSHNEELKHYFSPQSSTLLVPIDIAND